MAVATLLRIRLLRCLIFAKKTEDGEREIKADVPRLRERGRHFLKRLSEGVLVNFGKHPPGNETLRVFSDAGHYTETGGERL